MAHRFRPAGPASCASAVVASAAAIATGPSSPAERFITDPFSTEPDARLYRTGDLASMLPNGEICFRGRIDDQVKVRGNRVEPDGIAAQLARCPAVASCAVVPRENAQGENYLVAYIVAAGEQSRTSEELRAFLAQSLPEYMIPTAFVGLAELPLTSSGKLDKDALPEPSSENSLDQTGFRAPSTPIEIKLAAIVAEVLGTEAIGADDNFFLIGGHSSAGHASRHPRARGLRCRADAVAPFRSTDRGETCGDHREPRQARFDRRRKGPARARRLIVLPQVDVFWADLDAAASALPRWQALLDRDESARARAFASSATAIAISRATASFAYC